VFSLLLLLNAYSVAATNSCFFPDANLAPNYVPCSPTGDGACCAEGDFCTALGYCISDSKGYHYRGACSDSTWGNPSCPNYCMDDRNGNSTMVNVIACNAALSSGTWCCAYEGNCCTASTFVPVFGTMFAEATAAPTASASGIGPGIGPAETATSAATSTAASDGSAMNTGMIVGAVVATLLGLGAMSALLLYIVERRKSTRMALERQEENSRSTHYSAPEVPEKGNAPSTERPKGFYGGKYELSSTQTLELPTENVI